MSVLRTVIFLVVSVGLVFVSRRSLCRPRSHGFPRFFAFEAVLGLAALNVGPRWFADPFSPAQIASWLLLFSSLGMALIGFYMIFAMGKPGDRGGEDGDPALLSGFEDTSVLVTWGVYRYIRHPLYSSLLLLAWGIFFKNPSLIGGILAAAASVFLFVTARFEERENVTRFGEDYTEYMKVSKMFIPFLF